MREFTLPEQGNVCGALKPAADAAGRNGRWISCRNAHKVYAIWYIDQGNAATVLCSFNQASDISGTGAKVLTGTQRIWFIVDFAVSDAPVRQADAVNFTTDAGVKEKAVIIEVDPTTLDLAGGFNFLRAQTGASNATNITSALYIVIPNRFAGATPPSILV